MNIDAGVAAQIPSILLFFGAVLTLGGTVIAAIIARRSRKDRTPIDERADLTAQFEAMAAVNKTVIETMKATNEANDRIIKNQTDEKLRLDQQIAELTARLQEREAAIARLYEVRDKHYGEYDQLQSEAQQLRDALGLAVRQRDNLQNELDEANARLAALKPEALQDEISKQRATHETGAIEIADGGQQA